MTKQLSQKCVKCPPSVGVDSWRKLQIRKIPGQAEQITKMDQKTLKSIGGNTAVDCEIINLREKRGALCGRFEDSPRIMSIRSEKSRFAKSSAKTEINKLAQST
jgi:hypothetical protein